MRDPVTTPVRNYARRTQHGVAAVLDDLGFPEMVGHHGPHLFGLLGDEVEPSARTQERTAAVDEEMGDA